MNGVLDQLYTYDFIDSSDISNIGESIFLFALHVYQYW